MVRDTSNMLNKKTFFLFSFALSIFLIASAQAATRPIITISNYNTDTSIVAGGYFNLTLDLADQGSLCGIGTTVSVQASYPFLTTGVSSTVPVSVCNQTTVTLPLKIDAAAAGGSYPLTLIVGYSDWSNNVYSSSNTVNLVVGGMPNINANIINTNPSDVYQGDTATITVLLENDGSYEAQSVMGTLYSDSAAEVSPSSSYMYLGSLGSEQSANANFVVDIPKDSNTTQYPLTLTIQYLDENRVLQTKNISLVLNTKEKAIFQTADAGSQSFYANYQGRIAKINVTNVGTGIANQVEVNIEPQFPFTTDGSVRYINSINPGNSSIVEFVVDVDKDATPGNYGINLVFDYKDKDGNLLQDVETTNLTVRNKNIFRAIFIDYWFIWAVIIVIAIIVFLRNKKFAPQRAKLKEVIENKNKKSAKSSSRFTGG